MNGTKIGNLNYESYSYEAALIADLFRLILVNNGAKITFETVMSHLSKIDFLKKSLNEGYKNYLYYISTESPLINIERVNQRVHLGGHQVEESKIIKRYFKSLELLKSAVDNTYRSFIFDNSKKSPELILEVTNGQIVEYKSNYVPAWIDKYLLS